MGFFGLGVLSIASGSILIDLSVGWVEQLGTWEWESWDLGWDGMCWDGKFWA